MPTLKGLPPAVRHDTRVLLLGSFPGEASHAAGQYYAFRHNQFWRLVGDVIGADLVALSYERRLQVLQDAYIGLWDVIGACRRKGSLDGSIRAAEFNDFGPLVETCPDLRHAFFNGKTAARHIAHVAAFGLEVGILPSSSPANTMRYADKLAAWGIIKCAL